MWTDVTARPNGQLVAINGDGARVSFGMGVSRDCHAVHLRCAALDTVVAVVGQATADDTILVVADRGAVWPTPEAPYVSKVHGVQACAIRQVGGDHFVAYWVTDSGRQLSMVELDADLHVVSGPMLLPVQAGALGTSQGLLAVWPKVIYTDIAPRIITIKGVRYTLWSEARPWLIGQGQDVGGVIALDSRNNTLWRVSTLDTQLPPRIAVRPDGSGLAAISFGAGVFVESSAFTPLESPAPDQPPVVPTFAPSTRPIELFVFDAPGARENFVLCTLNSENYQAAADDADDRGVDLWGYWDTSGVYPPEWDAMMLNAGDVALVQAYPVRPGKNTGPMEPVSVTAQRVDACLTAMTSPRKGLALGFYRQITQVEPPVYNWPLQHVIDTLAAMWPLAIKHKVELIACFIHTRGNGKDGIVKWPALQETLRRMRAAMPMPPPLHQPTMPVPPTLPSSFPKGRRMPTLPTISLRTLSRGGKYLCVDPSDSTRVQYRDAVGAWEKVEAVKDGAMFVLRFIASNVVLCLTPDGKLETRPVTGVGGWERFAVYEMDPDKQILVIRNDDMGLAVQHVLYGAAA